MTDSDHLSTHSEASGDDLLNRDANERTRTGRRTSTGSVFYDFSNNMTSGTIQNAINVFTTGSSAVGAITNNTVGTNGVTSSAQVQASSIQVYHTY